MSEDIADVRCCCGRSCLFVAGIAVAMEGDKCRDSSIPEHILPPIPQEELEQAWIGDKRASELPIKMVRFFRGDCWSTKMLQYVAGKINERTKSL